MTTTTGSWFSKALRATAGLDKPAMGPGSISEETVCGLKTLRPLVLAAMTALILIAPVKQIFWPVDDTRRWFEIAKDMIQYGYALILLYGTMTMFQPIFERFAARDPFGDATARQFRKLALFLSPVGVAGFVATLTLLAISKWRGWDGTPIHDVDLSNAGLTALAAGGFCAVLSGVFAEAARIKREQELTV